MQIKGWQMALEPIVTTNPKQPNAKLSQSQHAAEQSFKNVLEQQLHAACGIKVSQHAQKRLQQRNIALTAGDWQNIAKAMQEAESKGIRESLLIYGDLALVASVKNKTIVTALAGQEKSNQIFTNIDGAVMVKKN